MINRTNHLTNPPLTTINPNKIDDKVKIAKITNDREGVDNLLTPGETMVLIP